MHRSFRVWLILGGLVVGCAGARLAADSRRADFGAFVQSLLDDRSEELFGIGRPLDHSAVGPFDGPSVDALELAPGLKATLVSSAVENAADQIALCRMMIIRRICSYATRRRRVRARSSSPRSTASTAGSTRFSIRCTSPPRSR
jgi:hypothetical protein